MNEIDARSKCIKELLSGVKYSLDYYQREYKWREKQIIELLDDLEGKFLDSFKPEHERSQVASYLPYFLGSIVISQKKSGDMFIIDGQQRLTSLTILLIYMNNLKSHGKNVVKIEDLIFSTQYGKKSFNMNIPERIPAFESLFKGLLYEPQEDNESVKNIVDRYNDIEANFPETLKNNVLAYFIDWLIEKVFMVRITAFSDEEAYTIFETMNDRGLSLNQSEMLKGYLLSKIINDDEKQEANKIWKDKVFKLLNIGKDEEIDFIKSWLRSKYANNIRDRKKGATAKDFDKIGTEFHKWVRDNKDDIGLKRSNDYLNFIVKEYVKYSDYYILLRNASIKFNPDFETVYFNAHHNFTLQYPVLLAAIKKEDEKEIAYKKIRIVSRYIDIVIARRFVNFKSLSYSALAYTMFNFIKEIRNAKLDNLVNILIKRVNELSETFEKVNTFYLHQQNRRNVHFLLARMTYYMEIKSGIQTDFVKYINKKVKKPYEIEHLWADKYDRYLDQFTDAQEFSQYRNYFGGLILLPRGFNQSLNADTYEDKVKHYLSDNILAQSLNEKYYEKKHSNFLNFIKEKELPFKPYAQFNRDDLHERQLLYKKICEEIWSSDRLKEELEK